MPLGLVEEGHLREVEAACQPVSKRAGALQAAQKWRNVQLRKQTVQILSRGAPTQVFGTQIFRNMGWRGRFYLFCAVTSQLLRVFSSFRGVCRFSLSMGSLWFILMFRGVSVSVCISIVRSCVLRSFVISRQRFLASGIRSSLSGYWPRSH